MYMYIHLPGCSPGRRLCWVRRLVEKQLVRQCGSRPDLFSHHQVHTHTHTHLNCHLPWTACLLICPPPSLPLTAAGSSLSPPLSPLPSPLHPQPGTGTGQHRTGIWPALPPLTLAPHSHVCHQQQLLYILYMYIHVHLPTYSTCIYLHV